MTIWMMQLYFVNCCTREFQTDMYAWTLCKLIPIIIQNGYHSKQKIVGNEFETSLRFAISTSEGSIYFFEKLRHTVRIEYHQFSETRAVATRIRKS